MSSLAVGEWTITAEGKDAEEHVVARGRKAVTIAEGLTEEAIIDVMFLQSVSGEIHITVSWPAASGVDAVEGEYDGSSTEVSFSQAASSAEFSKTSASSGVHTVILRLKGNAVVLASVVRSVHVYDWLDSAETVQLDESDIKAAPSAPQDLEATPGSGRIELCWQDTSIVETGFVVERSGKSGEGFSRIGSTLSANTACFTDSEVEAGATYYYRVKATNPYGDSVYSAEANCAMAALSSDATLESLSLSSGDLTPSFKSETISYSSSVSSCTHSVTVTPTVHESHAVVSVNGATVQSGSQSQPIALSDGTTTIVVVVTAQNGAQKTYSISITRGGTHGH